MASPRREPDAATTTGGRAEVLAGVSSVDLGGATALVTGSTDGIGRAVALALGRLGATVLVHGRDRAKGRAVLDRLERTRGSGELLLADFGRLEAVGDLAAAVAGHGPLDVLVNNAGGFFRRPRLTPEGFEYTFGVNHLAPFHLTDRLRGALAPSARVVVTASGAHRGADGLDLEGVRSLDGYRPWRAYQRSKLANVLFAAALARRLDGPTANSYHPGFVPGSGFLRELPRLVRGVVRAVRWLPDPLASRLAASPAEGAATAVYLAAAPEATEATGRYFVDREAREPAAPARDRARQERLWERSAAWVAETAAG